VVRTQGGRVNYRSLGAEGASTSRVNVIRENNSYELAEVRTELERRIAHMAIQDRQIMMPVLDNYLGLFCNDRGRAVVHDQGVSRN
jgi:hypothetical protein